MEYQKVLEAFDRFAKGSPTEVNLEDPLFQALNAGRTNIPIDEEDLEILKPFFAAFCDEYIQIGSNKLHTNFRMCENDILHVGDSHYVTFASPQQMEESMTRLRRVLIMFGYVTDEADGFYEEPGNEAHEEKQK